MPLEATDYKNEAVFADIELKPVPQEFKPAEFADYTCFTSLYRGIQDITLLANEFNSGFLSFQPERMDLTPDVIAMFTAVTAFIGY